MSFLPDSLGPMARFDERTLSWYTDHKAQKREKKNTEDNEKRNLIMTHGKKKVGKDWKKFRDDLKKKDTAGSKRDPKKGVKAVSGGKWGYVKNGKFTPDK